MGPVALVTSTDTVDGVVSVSVEGDVDLASSPELRRVLDDAIEISPRVRLELAGLTFIDSSGLSALVEAHRKARDAGGEVVLCDPPSMLTRLLDITSLNTLLVVEAASNAATGDEA